MANYNIRVSDKITFTEEDHKNLLTLLLKRWGNDEKALHSAWCRLLQSNPSVEQFQKMLRDLSIRGQ